MEIRGKARLPTEHRVTLRSGPAYLEFLLGNGTLDAEGRDSRPKMLEDDPLGYGQRTPRGVPHGERNTENFMCTALIAFQVFEDWPVFVAANRDEDHGRSFDPPQTEQRSGRVVLAPRDHLAGGTWIGGNDVGIFALITNRTDHAPPDPNARTRSRGLLVRDVLGSSSLDEALEIVEQTTELMTTSFNLILGNSEQLYAIERSPSQLRLELLSTGTHAIANGGRPNDKAVGEVKHALELWYDLNVPGSDPWETAPRLLECDEPRGKLPPLCKRTTPRGTVCSSLLGINAQGQLRLEQTAGPPGTQPYMPFTLEGSA